MPENVYLTSNHTAVCRCHSCQRTKTVDVSSYRDVNHPLRFRMKCPCGQVTTCILEKRQWYRKETDFPGAYIHYVEGQPKGKGFLTVKDISNTGLKLLIASSADLTLGDMLKVSFNLDNTARNLVEKKVVIRNLNPPYVGTEFAPTETIDKPLGFYLRS